MKQTDNLGLALYDSGDKLKITGEANSLNHNMKLIDAAIEKNKGEISGDLKKAILACFSKVAWADANGRTSYLALVNALNYNDYIAINVVYSGGDVDIDYDIENLRSNLAVTLVHAVEEMSVPIDNYTLIGTVKEGENIITVTYEDFSASFVVYGNSTYTMFDYITVNKEYSQLSVEDTIRTATYDDVGRFGYNIKYRPRTGVGDACILGARIGSGSTNSVAFYQSTPNNRLGVHMHGVDYSSIPLPSVDVTHEVEVVYATQSPTTIKLDGTEYQLTWAHTNAINAAFTLFVNPTNDGTAVYNMRNYVELNEFVVKGADGSVINHYKPCKRNVDNVIGLMDIVNDKFYTSQNVSAATIGNSNCKYSVGNWE